MSTHRNRAHRLSTVATLVLVALVSGACASHKFVRGEVDQKVSESEARSGERMGEIESRMEDNQSRISQNSTRLDEQGQDIENASQTAKEALDRALAAGKLAEGRLISETILSNDSVRFANEKSALTEDAAAAIDEFAAPLKEENTGYYIEIQGHTDSNGDELFNERLGEERAEAVRRYLNKEHGFPLHRMAVISYGESSPAYDNATRDGRAKNRRVVLVVLR